MRLRQTIGWTAAALVALLVIGAISGYLYLKSRSFQEYAIRALIQDANDATGGRLEVRNLDFELSTLTVHVYGITLHGSEPPDKAPLLQVDKIIVGIKIQSLLHRKVTLSELVIDHPVLHVRVRRDGTSNVPQAPPSQNSSHTSVFDLAARHVLLNNGEINYNDQKTPLNADLYDLGSEIHFDSLATRYSGKIAYDNGHLHYADYATLSHSLNAEFSVTPSKLSLQWATLKVGESTISSHAELSDYADPKVEGNYQILIHTQDFASLSPEVTLAGDISLSGTLRYHSVNDQPLLNSISLEGEIISKVLGASSKQGRVDLREIHGHYQLANGILQARDVDASLLGGHVKAEGGFQLLDAKATSKVRLSLKRISLQAAQQSVRSQESRRVTLLSTLDGSVDASWTGSTMNITGHADINLRAATASRSSPSMIPVEGSIHASYDRARAVIALRQTTLRTASLTLEMQGEIGDRSNLQIKANAPDLHQVQLLATAFIPSQAAVPEIFGSATLTSVIKGSGRQPDISGQLNVQNLQAEGSQWKTAKVNFQASPNQVKLQNGELINAHQGKASFNATVGLRNWSYVSSNPLQLNLSVQQLAMADLQRLARVEYPISGDLSANISLHGSQLDPIGYGSASIANAQAYGEAIHNFAANFTADKGTITSTLDISLPAGSAKASLVYTPNTKAYKINLDAPAVILQKLHTVQVKNLDLTGTVTASASGEGTLDQPQLTAVITLPQLQFRQNTIAQIKANLHVANQHADFILDSQVAQAAVRVHGTVALTGNYYAEAEVDTGTVQLEPLLTVYATSMPQGFKGQTELHATLKGPLKDKSQVEAHLTIPTLNATYQSLQIGSAGPIHADYSHSVVTLQPAEIRGTGTSLRVQGSVPLNETSAANLSAKGSLDVGVLRIFQPDLQSSGVLALDIHASGSAKTPVVQGQVHLQDIALSTPEAPLGVEKLNGTLDITNDRVLISDLKGQVGSGQVSVGGSIAFRPGVQFNLSLQSQSVRLRYPDGLRAVLDGNLVYTGTMDASTLNGQILIDSLSFTPDFDLAKFGDQFSGNSIPAQPGFADTVRLAVGVQSRESLSATSSQVSLAGRANLRVGGTAADPVITGRTDLTSGELFYRNLRYQLQHGIITFGNPTQTDPIMDVSLTTTVEQYNLTLTLRGSFDKLTTSYVSDPPLSSADIINLIALGKTTQESAAVGQSTDSMIASQAASQFSSSVQKLAGISSLQIDPQLGGNGQNPSARIALQQRVSKNFLFTFSTDVSQPGSEIVQGDYQLNKRWSVSVARDQLGGVSVDGRYHTKF